MKNNSLGLGTYYKCIIIFVLYFSINNTINITLFRQILSFKLKFFGFFLTLICENCILFSTRINHVYIFCNKVYLLTILIKTHTIYDLDISHNFNKNFYLIYVIDTLIIIIVVSTLIFISKNVEETNWNNTMNQLKIY